MARYRKYDVRISLDDKVRRLTPMAPSGEALWYYVLSMPESTMIPGLCRVGRAAIAEARGWTLDDFDRCFAELEREELAKADWCARVLWLPNVIKYDQPASPNVVAGWASYWDEIPLCPLKLEAWERLNSFFVELTRLKTAETKRDSDPEAWIKAFMKACPKPFGKPCGKDRAYARDRSRKQEQEQEREEGAPALPGIDLGASPKPPKSPTIPRGFVEQVWGVFNECRAEWARALATEPPRPMNLSEKARAKILAVTRETAAERGLEEAMERVLAAPRGVLHSEWHMGRKPPHYEQHLEWNHVFNITANVNQIVVLSDLARRSRNGGKAAPRGVRDLGTERQAAENRLLALVKAGKLPQETLDRASRELQTAKRAEDVDRVLQEVGACCSI